MQGKKIKLFDDEEPTHQILNKVPKKQEKKVENK
jgi:hypothetical protein